MEEDEWRYKIILIGDTGVGKSYILSRYKNITFNEENKPIFGCEFHTKRISFEGETIYLHIWDVSGQERYEGLTAGDN